MCVVICFAVPLVCLTNQTFLCASVGRGSLAFLWSGDCSAFDTHGSATVTVCKVTPPSLVSIKL